MNIVLLVMLAMCSSAGVSLFYKKGTERGADSISSPALMCAVTSVLISTIFAAAAIILDGAVAYPNRISVVFAVCLGVCYSFAAFFYLLSLSCGPYTISVIFLNTSSFMPILYSSIFPGERIRPLHGAGLALMLLSCICLTILRSRGAANVKANGRWMLFITLTFISNSMISYIIRLNTLLAPETGVASLFAGAYSVSAAVCFLFFAASGGFKKRIPLAPLLYPSSGVAVSLACNLIPAAELPKHLPSAVQYPAVNGSSMILGALIGRVFFNERLGFLGYLCIAGAIGAMFLLGAA